MSKLTEEALLAFRDELQKEAGFGALVARAAPALKNIGSAGGVGAALGAVGGAGVGAVRGYRDARAEGASAGEAALHGAGKALPGAVTGAGIGALGGMAGGALSKQNLAGLAERGGLIGAGSRFGQRQVHGLTGMLSPQELEGVRGGAHDALHTAFGASGKQIPKAGKRLAAIEAATGVTDPTMNLTSLPGYVRSAKAHGIGKVLKTGLREQVQNAHPLTAAMMLGIPAASIPATALGKDDGHKGERIGASVGGLVGNVAGGVMPLGGQMLVGGALGGAGKAVGKGIDKLRQKKNPQPPSNRQNIESAEGQHIATERVTSPAAAGQQPDIGL